MKKGIPLQVIGVFIYIIISSIDRFIIKVDDYIHVPIVIIAVSITIIGIIKTKNMRKNCTCTNECASGYNSNCTCANPECNCTENK